MRVERLDHLVLTVTDLEATLGFYTQVCGMTPVIEQDRHGLRFGDQLIKLHVWGSDFEPRAKLSTPGSADLCFVVDGGSEDVLAQLADVGVQVVAGPVQRHGTQGVITSVYCRDPDGNLVELASYVDGKEAVAQPENSVAADESAQVSAPVEAADQSPEAAQEPESHAATKPESSGSDVDGALDSQESAATVLIAAPVGLVPGDDAATAPA